jgi:hypothetical protein
LLTRELFDGRRVAWISPIRLYLIFSVAYFAVAALTQANVVPANKVPTDAETTAQLQRLGFENEQAVDEAVGEARAHWGPRVMFVLVPLYAFLIALVWRHRGSNYPHHLYFALHVHAAWFGAAALIAALRWMLPPIASTPLQVLLLIYAVWYAVLAFSRAYRATTGQAFGRVAPVLAVYFVVVITASALVAVAVVFNHR